MKRHDEATLLFALLLGCSSSIEAPGSTTIGSTTSSSDTMTTSTTSWTTTTSTTSSTTTTSTTSTTSTTTSPCGASGCASGQICVVPVCQHVAGEICFSGSPDAGASCPPGTVRGPQFDADCVQPGFACVDGCPPAAPFCLDVPAGCAPACACLGDDPCVGVNGGVCHDANIEGGVLSCSLSP